MSALLETLEQVRGNVNRILRDFVQVQRNEIYLGSDIEPVLDCLEGFVLSGGKRIRAALCYLGWLGAGGRPQDVESAYTAAAALELCHCFGLIHDDIIDKSDLRRGRPSLHRALQQCYENVTAGHGSEHFGESGALLMGDLCLMWADELLVRSCSDAVLRDVLRAYTEMRIAEVCGQTLEIMLQSSGTYDVEQSLAVAHYKTAKYATERPLQIGGALAGGSAALLDTYSRYGLPLGEAFQLRDDVLGVFGDPAHTGKSTVDDLHEGKPTVMAAFAWGRVDDAQREYLERWFGSPDLTSAEAEGIRHIFTETGALAATEEQIGRRRSQAAAVLTENCCSVVDDAVPMMQDFITVLVDRSR